MSKTIYITCFLLCNLSLAIGQVAHHFHLGYTFTRLRAVDRIPEGNRHFGTIHRTKNFVGRSGASAGYELMWRFGEIFYTSAGVNAALYRSGLHYSTYSYGSPCGRCDSFTLPERRGLRATYSNLYLKVPLTLSIPFTLKADFFFKFGVDLMWDLKSFGQWDYLELTQFFELINETWTSRVLETRVQRAGLPVNSAQQGIILALWKKVNLFDQALIAEFNFRFALGQLQPQPALSQFNYGLQIGYCFGRGVREATVAD